MSTEWDGQDRRSSKLTDEEAERIAIRAAHIIEANFTLHVGKATLKVITYVVGAGVLAFLAWLDIRGKLKL